MEFHFLPSVNSQLSRGAASFREGFAQVTVYSELGFDKHNLKLSEIIEALKQAFHPMTTLEYNAQRVTITSVDDIPSQPSDNWYQAGITINYQSIVQGI